MPSEPIELPPQVAKAFVRDKRAFFKAKDQLKQDEIAARQLHALHAFQRPREKKLRLADVKQMFLQMRDTISAAARRSGKVKAVTGLRIGDGFLRQLTSG